MSIVRKLEGVDYDSDITVDIKPTYGSGGDILCTVMDLHLTPITIFKDNIYNIKKQKKYIIKKNDFDMGGCFLCFNIQASPAQNKSKCDITITLLQNGKKIKKFRVQKETSRIFHITGKTKEV